MNDQQINSPQRVYIFDTTLRDGQQCPGAGMNFKKNLEYAGLAVDLGVDVLEAGFPAASRADFEIVLAIAGEYFKSPQAPVIAALCQLRDEQIDRDFDEYELEAEEAGPVFQLIARYAF